MKKLIFTAVVLVAAVAALGVTIDMQSNSPVIRPARLAEPVQVFASGRIEGATSEIELRPQLAGRITKAPVREGQIVNEGDLLLQLDDRQRHQETELAASELELAQAQLERLLNGAHPQQRSEAAAICRAREAELKLAEMTWERTQRILHDRATTQQEADNQMMRVRMLKNEVEAAKAHSAFLESNARPDEIRIEQARVAAAKARLELAKVQEERTRLLAPCHAQVLKINGKAGELAGPNTSEPAVILADTSHLFVRAYVEELDAPRVEAGMSTTISMDGLQDQKYSGRVVSVSPRMGAKNVWSDRATEKLNTKTREAMVEVFRPDQRWVLGKRVDVMIDLKKSGRSPCRDSAPSGNRPEKSK
jgi:HlyD family secretion protein